MEQWHILMLIVGTSNTVTIENNIENPLWYGRDRRVISRWQLGKNLEALTQLWIDEIQNKWEPIEFRACQDFLGISVKEVSTDFRGVLEYLDDTSVSFCDEIENDIFMRNSQLFSSRRVENSENFQNGLYVVRRKYFN